jgi:hypothetical protein
MLKDIELLNDAKVGVAVVKELNDALEEVWNVYVVNFNTKDIQNVLVTCKGYGEIDNEPRETTVVRYFLGDIPAQNFIKVEPINPDLFVLNNEYFLTFYENGNILDKKLTFLSNTIFDDLLTEIALIRKPGLLLT